MRVLQINQEQPRTTMQAVQSSQAGGSILYSSSTERPTTEYSVLSTPTFTRSTPLPVSSRSANTIPNLPQTQLPTPVNSDTPTDVEKRSSRRSKAKTLQAFQADSEDFENPVHEDDEDDDEDEEGPMVAWFIFLTRLSRQSLELLSFCGDSEARSSLLR